MSEYIGQPSCVPAKCLARFPSGFISVRQYVMYSSSGSVFLYFDYFPFLLIIIVLYAPNIAVSYKQHVLLCLRELVGHIRRTPVFVSLHCVSRDEHQ